MAPKNKDAILNRGAACLECRKRKLKCDAVKPYCGSCVKSARQDRCIYEEIRNKNLADQLEARVNQLERMVERMEREEQQPATLGSALPVGSATPSGIATLQAQASLVEAWSRLPDESHNYLVDIFMTYLPKSNLQIHVDRFMQSLTLPDEDPRSMHPAMLSAIYLLACYHWSDLLANYETSFLAQARAAMQDSLSKTDRLFTGYIQAGILVTEYLLNRGRFREAYHQMIQTARFSIGCNLHKITMSGMPGGLLPPPVDGLELGERILAFWAVFMLDQRCCVIMGLPSSFPKGDDIDTRSRIDTVWPNSINEYAEGQVATSDSMTLRFLCTDGPPFAMQDTDYMFRIRLQSFALYRFAGDAEMSSADIDLAINQFLRRIPAPDPSDQVNMPSVVIAHVVARAASIRLCARSSATQTMDERALEASLGCARMIHLLTVSDYDMWSLDIVLSYIWADCAKIITRHIKNKEQAGAREEGARLRPALSAILAGLSRAAQVYAVISSEVQAIESLVASLSG